MAAADDASNGLYRAILGKDATALELALVEGDIDALSSVRRKIRGLPSWLSTESVSALELASAIGFTAGVRLLLQFGFPADSGRRPEEALVGMQMTPLMAASRSASIESVELLLAERASTRVFNHSGSALHLAVEAALEAQARPPVYFAALHCVARLLRAGADPGFRPLTGLTPIHAALICNDVRCLALLLALSESTYVTKAVSQPLPDTYTIYASNGFPFTSPTPLFYAVSIANADATSILLQYGAHRNYTTASGVHINAKQFAVSDAARMTRVLESVSSSAFLRSTSDTVNTLIAGVGGRSGPLPDPPSVSSTRVSQRRMPSGADASASSAVASVVAATSASTQPATSTRTSDPWGASAAAPASASSATESSRRTGGVTWESAWGADDPSADPGGSPANAGPTSWTTSAPAATTTAAVAATATMTTAATAPSASISAATTSSSGDGWGGGWDSAASSGTRVAATVATSDAALRPTAPPAEDPWASNSSKEAEPEDEPRRLGAAADLAGPATTSIARAPSSDEVEAMKLHVAELRAKRDAISAIAAERTSAAMAAMAAVSGEAAPTSRAAEAAPGLIAMVSSASSASSGPSSAAKATTASESSLTEPSRAEEEVAALRKLLEQERAERAAAARRADEAQEALKRQQASHLEALSGIAARTTDAAAAAEAAAKEARANLVSLGEAIGVGMKLLNEVGESQRKALLAIADKVQARVDESLRDADSQIGAARKDVAADLLLTAEQSIAEIREAGDRQLAALTRTFASSLAKQADEQVARAIHAARSSLSAIGESAGASTATTSADLADTIRRIVQEELAKAPLAAVVPRASVTASVPAVAAAEPPHRPEPAISPGLSTEGARRVSTQASASSSSDEAPAPVTAPGAAAIAARVSSSSAAVADASATLSVPRSAIRFRRCAPPTCVAASDLSSDAEDERLASASDSSMMRRQPVSGVEIHLAEFHAEQTGGWERAVYKSFGKADADPITVRRVLAECMHHRESRGHTNILTLWGVTTDGDGPLGIVMEEAGAFFIAPRTLMMVICDIAFGGTARWLGLPGDGSASAVASPDAALALVIPAVPSRTRAALDRLRAAMESVAVLGDLHELSTAEAVNTRKHGLLTAADIISRSSAAAWPHSAPVHVVRSLKDLLVAVWRAAHDSVALLRQISRSLLQAAADAESVADDPIQAEEVRVGLEAMLTEVNAAFGLPGPSTRPTMAQLDDAAAHETWRLFPLPSRLQILAGAAEGLAQLHARGIMHRDMKPDNVLLVGSTPKVGDFGSAKLDLAGAAPATSSAPALLRMRSSGDVPVGTDEYIAPEVWARGDPEAVHLAGCGSDIWSFGMMIAATLDAELTDPIQRQAIRSGLDSVEAQELVMEHGMRPSLATLLEDHRLPANVTSTHLSDPTSVWAQVEALMNSCLHLDPESRPTMAQVATRLKELADATA